MDIRIKPNKLRGEVGGIPSKSISHRYIVSASLAKGESRIDNIIYSDDIRATIGAMRALGAEIKEGEDFLVIRGMDVNTPPKERVIDCKESGSTIRFLLPLLTLFEGGFTLKASGKLLERPMSPYFNIFDKEGIEYKLNKDSLEIIKNKRLSQKTYRVRGDISSQFITGLLFLLPLMDYDSEIEIEGELQSKGYVDLTLDAMDKSCVYVDNDGYKRFKIKGNQQYKSGVFTVEADYSQAAFFIVAKALGNDLKLKNLNKNSLQGDGKIVELVENYGEKLHGISYDASEIPDIVPILALLSALSEGRSEIKNISRLRIKECDRLEAVYSELKKLGAKIEIVSREGREDLVIEGVQKLRGTRVDSYKDHRMAMMLAIASTVCEEDVIIRDAQSVQKSFPNFWEVFEDLGGKIEVEDDSDLG